MNLPVEHFCLLSFRFVSFEHHQLVEPLEIVSLTLVSENVFNSRQKSSQLPFSTFISAGSA